MNAMNNAPVLLTMADYYGTLAAARCLGKRRIPVTVAEWRLLAPARWSKYVRRCVKCPDPARPELFLEWLLEFGERRPGHVLYPTSDDLSWLFARHREALSKHYFMFQPGLGPTYALLNKVKLHAACAEVGLEVPRTWLPMTRGEVERVAGEAQFPVLIKPRTQVLFASRTKGVLVRRAEELVPRYEKFLEDHHYGELLLAQDPAVSWPMVQAYHQEGRQRIHSLGGFIDDRGEHFVVRASRKVLQRPRRLGIGLCFEETAEVPGLSAKVAALCRGIGYHGIFEVEFIRLDAADLLIDFNPRFYSQMAFEVARHLPLPLLAYEAALGHREAVRHLADRSRQAESESGRVYVHRAMLGLTLLASRAAGGLTALDARRWREWLEAHRSRATDAVADDEDPVPGVVDLALLVAHWSRHPRALMRAAAEEA